jgi:hypothetical protein
MAAGAFVLITVCGVVRGVVLGVCGVIEGVVPDGQRANHFLLSIFSVFQGGSDSRRS